MPDPDDDSSDTQSACQPWPSCRTAKPTDGDGSSTPRESATPTTQPPFDPADCHTWFELTRICVKIDEKDGMATITYH